MICGIDEAGRGPIAGPLVMAGVILKGEIEGLDDSKKLSAKKREILFDEIIQKTKEDLEKKKAYYPLDMLGMSLSYNPFVPRDVKPFLTKEEKIKGKSFF